MSGTPAQPIRLGLMTPKTGVASLYGEDIARAAGIAAARVNAADGIDGRPLELVVADDGSTPDQAIKAGRRLVQKDGCVALIGNLMSNVRLEVVDSVAQPLEVPLLNFSFYEGSISSPYFFNFAALPNQQIDLMIPYMAERVGPRMYFAGNNYEWPRGSISTAMQALTRADGEVVGEDYTPIGVSAEDCDAILQRMVHAGPDVFVPYFAGTDQVRLLKRLYELGLHDRVTVLMGHFDEVMAGQLAPDARNGLYASNSYFMTVDTDANRELLADLAALAGIDGLWPKGDGVISHFGEGAHTCVTAFAHAARGTASLDTGNLIPALERVSLAAAQGPIAMDRQTHHAHVNCYLCRCDRSGRFTVLESFGQVAPAIPERYTDDPANRSVPHMPRHRGKAERRRLRAAAQQTSDVPLVICDASGGIVDANEAAAAAFGYTLDEFVGRQVEALVPPHLRESHRTALRRVRDSGAEQVPMGSHRQIYGYRKDGTYFPISATVTRMQVKGEVLFTLSIHDISARRVVESELRRAATHDELTGLPNRACISERLTRSLERASRGPDVVGVLLIDLDSFKSVNDTFGHEAGDDVLRQVATRLTQSIRPGDAVARLAGDEFLVVAERLRRPEDLARLAQRIIASMDAPIEWAATAIRVTASIGLAVGETGSDVQGLITQADLAMTNVKERHGCDWEFYSTALHTSAQRRQQLSQHVRAAVDNDEFYAHFQPIVRLTDGRIVGAEILSRWNSPIGPVSPAEFIPIAETTGAIHALGSWVTRQACQAEASWQGRWGKAAPRIFINVSPQQLTMPRFVTDFLAAARAAGTDLSQLVVELTESGLMADLSVAKDVVQDLVDHGAAVAVDDFGTGYSSLAELTQLPVQIVKIDRSFIASAGTGERSARVLQAVVDLARTLSLHAVAEGVETSAEAELVRRFGCQYAQGFYFGGPMSRAEIENAISHQLASTGPGALHAFPTQVSRGAAPAPVLRALDDAS